VAIQLASLLLGLAIGFLLGLSLIAWYTQHVINTFADALVEKLMQALTDKIMRRVDASIDYKILEPMRSCMNGFSSYEAFRERQEKGVE